MKKLSLLRYTSIGMATVGLGLGVAAADSVTIGGTANNTDNNVHSTNHSTLKVTDNSSRKVDNDTDQDVSTGSVTGHDAAKLGDATSGGASADSRTTTSITGGSGSGWMSMMPSSSSMGDSDVTIDGTFNDTNNHVNLTNTATWTFTDKSKTSVDNDTDQDVRTGSVSVSNVASGGDLTSGDASATAQTTTTINR